MNTNETLQSLQDDERLKIYDLIISACTHLYSKNKLQKEKFRELVGPMSKLAKTDPLFMAHFTAWAFKNSKSKDLKVLALFFNALSDADGSPFYVGSKHNKPNLRAISGYLLQELDPHLAKRIIDFTKEKFEVKGFLSYGKHFPSHLRSALKKYVLYREFNLSMIHGIKRAGLGKDFISMYKSLNLLPSIQAASILNWKQRGRNIEKSSVDFSSMTSSEIANYLSNNNISPIVAISMLPNEKLNKNIAKLLLDKCTGNQAIILQNYFRTRGFLEIEEVKKIFTKKVSQATTAIDRIDTLSKDLSDDDKKEMSAIRSKKRKEVVGDIGKIFLHIDKSVSMTDAITYALNNASIFAECVDNPKVNFKWGTFGQRATLLKVPDSFEKDDFYSILYGLKADEGSTDCIGLYKHAREFGADVDVYFTDEGHNGGDIKKRIEKFHAKNPNLQKPKAAIIVSWSSGFHNPLKNELESCGIPTSIMDPNTLLESALVAESVKVALQGRMVIIDEIMNTSLPKAPKWWNDSAISDHYKNILATQKTE